MYRLKPFLASILLVLLISCAHISSQPNTPVFSTEPLMQSASWTIGWWEDRHNEKRYAAKNVKVLLLAIFPRHCFPENEMRRRNEEVNELISNLDYGDNIHYLNVNEVFLNEKLFLQVTLMPDLLHPNESGYQRWAEAI